MENRLRTHSDILDAQETEAYKNKAVASKFKQQMSYGIGAAMVFGLVSALGKALVDGLASQATASVLGMSVGVSTLATAGLVGLGVFGVGFLFLSAKFLSENTVLDQALQAKQMAKAQNLAQVPTIAVTAPVKARATQTFPEHAHAAADSKPSKWTERVAPAAAAAEQAAWGDKVRATQAAEAAPTLH